MAENNTKRKGLTSPSLRKKKPLPPPEPRSRTLPPPPHSSQGPPLPPRRTSRASPSPRHVDNDNKPPPIPSSRTSPSPRHVGNDNKAPPLPSSPRPFIQGFSSPTSPGSPSRYTQQPLGSQLHDQDEELLCELLSGKESEKLTLPQLVKTYSKFFPLRMKVVKGFYTDRVEVAAEEMYNIHFLKRAKVVTINDTYGDKYVIPMNSAIQFGLVYNPADEYATFATVGDLIAAPTLPNLVLAEKAFRGNDHKSSVDKDEVLVLQGVYKPPKFGISHMVLKVYSLTKGEEKTLTRSCNGQFTTNPYSTRLHLPEIMKHVNNPFQLKARMFWDCDMAEDLPSNLTSDVITILAQTTESSLIATQFVPEESADEVVSSVPDESELTEVADIPLDLDIEVVVMSPPESETDRLYVDTREIYQAFDPSKIKTLKDTPTGEMCVAQSQLYTAVREGYETEGLDLEMPMMAYGTQRKKDHTANGTNDKEIDSDEYELVDYSDRNKKRSGAPPIKKAQSLQEGPQQDSTVASQVNSLKGAFTLLQSQLQSLESTQRKQTMQLIGMKSSLAEANAPKTMSELSRIGLLVDGLTKRCDALHEEIAQLKQQMPMSEAPTGSQQEKNRAELATLTQTQVLKILDSMGMKAYQGTFAKESVDGEILLQCDPSVLENELGVSSKIHRIRLMKVINGVYSALSILEGEGPYVEFNATRSDS